MEQQYIKNSMRIADAHCHIYPGKIAEKATAAVGAFYGAGMTTPGYPHALIESGEKIGVSHYLVCSVATKPEQSAAINDFIALKCKTYPQFLGFAALHPLQTDWNEEITRCLGLGLRGVKFHPDFQGFNIDEPAMLPVYERLREENMPILFHMGDDRFDFSAPRRLAALLRALPGLRVIAAHFGGYQAWDEAERELGGLDVVFDTSSSLWKLSRERALRLVRAYGPERLMFGTDFPMWDHEGELTRFFSLGLTDAENERILYGTFAEFFSLPENE